MGMEGQILTNAQDASSLQMGRFSSDSRVGSGGLGEEVCAIVAADLQSWGLLLPLWPPPPTLRHHSLYPSSPTSPSFSHRKPLKGEQNLTAEAALTF